MKRNYKKFCLKYDRQSGGMLMELMLSVALAAITIPFVVRYQKNTIERARNVAVVKQMDMVRGALERCIFENRTDLISKGVNPDGYRVFSNPNETECVMLSNDSETDPMGLINYGLTPEFANDYADKYKLRIRRSNDNTGQPVLQGIVLLADGAINSMRTREIVNLGGGQVGFTDDNYVRGGFNAFSTEKTTYGLEGQEGIVQTTDTMRGDTRYLWRTSDSTNTDRTMLSFLNLDGHDIKNIGGFAANNAYFSDRITLDSTYPLGDNTSTISTLKFTKRINLNGTNLTGDKAVVNSNFAAATEGDHSLNVNNNLTINSNSSVAGFVVNCVPTSDTDNTCANTIELNADTFTIPMCKDSENRETCLSMGSINFDTCDITNNLELFQLESSTATITYTDKAIASHLRMGGTNPIMATKSEDDKYYIKSHEANFNQMNLNGSLTTSNGNTLKGLSALFNYIVEKEKVLYNNTNLNNTNLDNMYGAAWLNFYENDAGGNDVGFYLKKFRYMQHILNMKMACSTQNSPDCPGVEKIKACINLAECREKVGNCKNTDHACVLEIVNSYGN